MAALDSMDERQPMALDCPVHIRRYQYDMMSKLALEEGSSISELVALAVRDYLNVRHMEKLAEQISKPIQGHPVLCSCCHKSELETITIELPEKQTVQVTRLPSVSVTIDEDYCHTCGKNSSSTC